jgi:hypothetical protein
MRRLAVPATHSPQDDRLTHPFGSGHAPREGKGDTSLIIPVSRDGRTSPAHEGPSPEDKGGAKALLVLSRA